jgi:hypothetical protein
MSPDYRPPQTEFQEKRIKRLGGAVEKQSISVNGRSLECTAWDGGLYNRGTRLEWFSVGEVGPKREVGKEEEEEKKRAGQTKKRGRRPGIAGKGSKRPELWEENVLARAPEEVREVDPAELGFGAERPECEIEPCKPLTGMALPAFSLE